MNPELQRALDSKLLRLADDEFILGHRNSEWTGHGPILEEDIAFSNLALDEIGHGILWYRILAKLRGEDPDTYPDKLVYQRKAADFHNADVVAMPRTDWAFSMLRQFLFDMYESIHVPALLASSYAPIADAAAKIKQEEVYHLYHTKAWTLRLGRGTEESNRRMQAALDRLWGPVQQLFVPGRDESLLVAARITPDLQPIHDQWNDTVVPFLESCELAVPRNVVAASQFSPADRRPGDTPDMQALIDELQQVARIAPDAVW